MSFLVCSSHFCFSLKAVGFDIAETLISQGNSYAKELKLPCEFVECNILDIGRKFASSFAIILFTIGAITWFEDLEARFRVVSRCLRPDGSMILHDFHPVMNMLPLPGKELYRYDILSVLLLSRKRK